MSEFIDFLIYLRDEFHKNDVPLPKYRITSSYFVPRTAYLRMQTYDHLPPTYTPDDAADFFGTLLSAARRTALALASLTADEAQQSETRKDPASEAVAAFYGNLGQTLRLAAEQKTAFNALTLGGLFAKIDYLCKEHDLPWALRIALGAARTNATRLAGPWRHDLRAVCRFISAIYGAEIPQPLREFFPTDDEQPQSGPADAKSEDRPDVLRVTVSSWDADHIHVRSESADDLAVALHIGDSDWSYLTRLIAEGSQLNLVRPRRVDTHLEADLIIYEPDYLVDVTAVASCFEEYCNSPFLHLLHKISPHQQSSAILLGDLAGRYLDDEVHGRNNDAAATTADFIKENALTFLSLMAEGALDYDDFLARADAQLANIRVALHDGLDARVGGYDPSHVMLEPSFACEMLGLQGRMDFLQLDHRVLIEQKSGKGAYNPGSPDTPRHQPKHYVQMLLYMAILRYNFSKQFRAIGGNLQAFLLYSRYSEPLLGLGPAPRLLFDAIRVRNGLVWYEDYYCKGGVRLLEKMTADKLNQLSAHGVLWERYQRPQIDALLSPIRQATPLERDYYFRMLQFVTLEHRIAKVGNNTAQSNCYASKWYLTLAEKHESGEIHDRLRLAEATPDTVTFSLTADEGIDSTNFRLGDIVITYPYDAGSDPDCRRTMVHRGTLIAITPGTLVVRLRAPQTDASVFTRDAHRPWALEHDNFESSFGNLYSGIHSFLSAPAERRNLLMLQRPPRVDTSATLRGSYGAFDDLALRVKQARDFFLIIGPPGTGKTSYGMLYTLKEQLLEPDTNVLLLSYTNRAVDEICSKLVEEGIPFVRIGNPHNCDPSYHPYLLQQIATDGLAAMESLVATTRVFVGTTTTMSSRHALFSLKQFDLAIIDEASQILEPHLLGLLSQQHDGRSAIGKFVMIGDHKQLPAVVQQSQEQSAVAKASLHAIGLTDCRMSLFERLLRRYGNDASTTFMLRRQGRMHRDIAAFPSEVFYKGLLDVVPLPHQVEEGECRLSFIAAPAPEASVNDKVNAVEARLIADLTTDIALREGWLRPTDTGLAATATTPDSASGIGIIVPYRNQIAAIRALLPAPLRDITIDTVERYQGSQRDHIIYGFTIQKRYQLAFLTSNVFCEDGHPIDRKLNVAMTRARRHLYLVGNRELLEQNRTFARLIDYALHDAKNDN